MSRARLLTLPRNRRLIGQYVGVVSIVAGLVVLSLGAHRVFASGSSSGPTPGIGVFRTGGTYSGASGYDRYSLVTVGPGDATSAAALATKSLVSMSGTSVQTAWSTGVSYQEAFSHKWLLKDASGNYLRTSSGGYIGDVGDPAYQQRFIDDVSAFLAGHGNYGVFIDQMFMTLQGLSGTPVKYPTQQSWADATVSFAAKVGPALKARGYYVLFGAQGYIPGNSASDTGALTASWWSRLAPYASGLKVNYWLQNPNNLSQLRSNGSAWYQNWGGWESLVATAQRLNVDFVAGTVGTSTSVETMRYGKASFLLEWDGGGGVFTYAVGAGDPWNQEWTMDIGQPSGAKYQVGVGWRRDFTNGVALVNPSATTSQAFTLGGTFVKADGTSVSSITLAPTTGIVLRKGTAPPPTAPTNGSLPAVSGTAQVGSSLSSSTGSWSGSPTSYGYQWQRCSSGGSCAAILGATGSGYALQSIDAGATMRVVVTASNSGGSASATSSPTPVVASAPVAAPSNTALPVVSGTAQVGSSLSSSTGSWSGSPTSYAYQWQRCPSGGSCAAILGATGSGYVLQSIDAGATLRVVVTASNAGGSASATSSPTSVVAAAVTAPANTALPAVTGTAQVGSSLSSSTGSWSGSPTSYAYQWQRCSSAGSSCVAVSGATGTTYALQSADAGSTMRVVVTASNSGGSSSATSAPSAAVASAPAPATAPSPTPAPAPLMDMRATIVNSLPTGGLNGSADPAVWDCVCYQNSDITVGSDATWSKVYNVRINSASRNPWWSGQTSSSAELTRARTITLGETIWYAQSLYIPTSGFQVPSRNEGWMLVSQLGYPAYISPPIGIAVEKEGVGLDRNGGVVQTNLATDPTAILRANYVPLSSVQGQWLDILVGVKWTIDNTGWVVMKTRIHGSSTWTTQYSATNTPTAQVMVNQSFNGGIAEKQGGYVGYFGNGTNAVPSGFSTTYKLRGLSLHATEADAVANLAGQ